MEWSNRSKWQNKGFKSTIKQIASKSVFEISSVVSKEKNRVEGISSKEVPNAAIVREID